MKHGRDIKKLLIFIPEFPMLSETFIEREVSQLIKSGTFDVTVVSLKKSDGHISDNVLDRLHYVQLGLLTTLVAALTYIPLRFSKVIAAHKLVVGEDKVPYFLSIRKNDADLRAKTSILGRFHNSRFIHFLKGIAYAKVFEKYEPDHLHVHFFSDSSTIGMVAAKVLGIPFSISAHARDVFVDGSLISVKAKEAKFITVCNGNAWREAVDQANKTKSSGKVRLLYHGIDYKKVFSVAGEKPKPEKLFIFTVARLVEKKGLKYLIEASSLLKAKGFKHVVKIVGARGNLYESLLKQIDSLGLRDTVEILGGGKGLPNQEIIQYLRVADVFVMPFIQTAEGDVDGIPNVLVEAGLAKLPVVVTDAGGIPDLVVNEKNGIVVEQRNPRLLADSIEKLAADIELRKRLGEALHKDVLEKFDIQKNIKELEDLILA